MPAFQGTRTGPPPQRATRSVRKPKKSGIPGGAGVPLQSFPFPLTTRNNDLTRRMPASAPSKVQP
jgi:hypothetical protein